MDLQIDLSGILKKKRHQYFQIGFAELKTFFPLICNITVTVMNGPMSHPYKQYGASCRMRQQIDSSLVAWLTMSLCIGVLAFAEHIFCPPPLSLSLTVSLSVLSLSHCLFFCPLALSPSPHPGARRAC